MITGEIKGPGWEMKFQSVSEEALYTRIRAIALELVQIADEEERKLGIKRGATLLYRAPGKN